MKFVKKKKGFVLSDAIMAMALALIIGVTLTLLISSFNKMTENQEDNIEAYQFANSVSEELQAMNDTFLNGTSMSEDGWQMVQEVQRDLNTYKVYARVEDDTYTPDLKVITIKLEWKDELGEKKKIEMKSFKTASSNNGEIIDEDDGGIRQ